MPFNQDDQRERAMVGALNLQVRADRARHEEDAYLDVQVDGRLHRLLFECKSSPEAQDFGTGRDTGLKKLEQWSSFHFVFGWFVARDNLPIRMWYGSPRMMRKWIDDEIAYIEPDILLSNLVPTKVGDDAVTVLFGDKHEISYTEMHRVMKDSWNAKQAEDRPDLYALNADLNRGRTRRDYLYSRNSALKAVRDRTAYLLDRGTTVNNRKIPHRYVMGNCAELTSTAWARSLENVIATEVKLQAPDNPGNEAYSGDRIEAQGNYS
jgi:hypothetical protein